MEEKVYFKEEEIKDENDVFCGHSKIVMIGDESNDYYSYLDSDIKMVVRKDGSIYFSDYERDGAIWINFSQLEHLEKIVKIAREQINKKDIL